MAVTTVSSPSVAVEKAYTIRTVTSKDGTTISYQIYGHGPALVLVQGTMGTSEEFSQLAEALASSFTVYVPDRRGRGKSGPTGSNYGMQKEIEDLDALLTKIGAHFVFGVSSG